MHLWAVHVWAVLLVVVAGRTATAAASFEQLCSALPAHAAVSGQSLTVLEEEAWRQVQALRSSSSSDRSCQLQCELLTELSRTRRLLGQSTIEAAGHLCQAFQLGACCQHDMALLREQARVVHAIAGRDCLAEPLPLSMVSLCDTANQAVPHVHHHHHPPRAFDAIVSVTEWDKVFVAHALPYALMAVADMLGAQLHVLARPQWSKASCSNSWWGRWWNSKARAATKSLFKDKRVLVVVEAAYLQGCQPISKLREELFGEASKFIVLGSDTVYRSSTNLCEWPQCSEADLFLDLVDGAAVGFQRRHGVPANTWMWTPSNTMLKLLHGFAHLTRDVPRAAKTVTLFMRIAGFPFREAMVKGLQAAGYTVHGGLDPTAGTLQEIFMLYRRSVVVVGSTSSSVPWSPCRSMKGFRDWIGPPLGAVLIYDDHPDVLRKYAHVPTHQHGNLTDLLLLLQRDHVSHVGSEQRHRLLAQQQRWLASNLLDWQLVHYVRQLIALSSDSQSSLGLTNFPALHHQQAPGWVLPLNASVPLDGCVVDPPSLSS